MSMVPRMSVMVPFKDTEGEFPLQDVKTAKEVLLGLKKLGWGNAEMVDNKDDSTTMLIPLFEATEQEIVDYLNRNAEYFVLMPK